MKSKNSYFILAFVFAVSLFPAPVDAVTGSGSTGTSTKAYPGAIKDTIKDRNTQIKDARDTFKGVVATGTKAIKDARDVFKNASTTATGTRKEALKDLRENVKEVRGDIKDARGELREKVKDIREEFRDRVGEIRKSRIEGYFERVLRRFEAAFDRLTELADRIASRIQKLDEVNPNFDPTQSTELLGVARTKISEGKALLAGLPAQFDAIFTDSATSTPQGEFQKVRELTNSVKTKAKEAHAALIDAIRSIKANTGTSTPPTATTTTSN